MCSFLFIHSTRSLLLNTTTLTKSLEYHFRRGPDHSRALALDLHGNEYSSEIADLDSVSQFVDRLPESTRTLCFHSRLAVTNPDSEDSFQPFPASDSKLLLFNGQIYNHRDLALRFLGEQIPPSEGLSDTRILGKLLLIYGSSIISHLEGIFSFLLFDKQSGSLLLSRDHVGTKPLYYSVNEHSLVVSSTISPIVSIHQRKSVDPKRASQYINCGKTVFRSKTLIRDIYTFRPGHSYSAELYSKRPFLFKRNKWNYLCLASSYSCVIPSLIKSVVLESHSDVPVSALLSGGLDSTIVCGIVTRRSGVTGSAPISSFFTGLPLDSSVSEFSAAKKTSEVLNVPLNSIHLAANHEEMMSKFVSTSLLPLPSESFLLELNLYRDISMTEAKVVLTGHGADEYTGGYVERFAVSYILQSLLAFDLRGASSFARANISILANRPFKKLMLFAKRHLHDLFNVWYRDLGCVLCLSDKLRLLFLPYTLQKICETYDASSLEEQLQYSDSMSMFYGLEARVPLANRRLINVVVSNNLTSDGFTKKPMRDYLEYLGLGHVASIRRKTGFVLARPNSKSSSILCNRFEFRSKCLDILNRALEVL